MTTPKPLLQRMTTMARAVVHDPDKQLPGQVGHGTLMALHGRAIGLDADGKPKIVPATVLLAPSLASLEQLMQHVGRQPAALATESRRSLLAQLTADDPLERVVMRVQQAATPLLGEVLKDEPLLLVQGYQDQYLLLASVPYGPGAHDHWEALMRGLLDTLECRDERRKFHNALWRVTPRNTAQTQNAEAA
jgi:hypothetical protein